jgi:hypothetical protein
MLLTREKAQILVNTVKTKFNQYSVVTVSTCRSLLGDRYELLRTDPIRNKGPAEGYVYTWNLVDYLCTEDPMGRKK